MKRKKQRKKAKQKASLTDRETAISLAAMVLLIFSAMIDPMISFAIAAMIIIVFILHKIISRD